MINLINDELLSRYFLITIQSVFCIIVYKYIDGNSVRIIRNKFILINHSDILHLYPLSTARRCLSIIYLALVNFITAKTSFSSIKFIVLKAIILITYWIYRKVMFDSPPLSISQKAFPLFLFYFKRYRKHFHLEILRKCIKKP